MLRIEQVIQDLNNHLNSSGFYFLSEERGEELSALILHDWKMKFENALKLDFQERLNLSGLMLSQHFELFGDRGETVWRNNIVVQDDSAPVKLVVWFKANIYHKIAGINLDEANIRQAKYTGTDKNAAAVFKKLKAKQKDGYESLVPVKELFGS